jgi:AcrR family transcriptional regulator
MTRRYDSSGRKRAAEQTRKRIVDAALRLHWEGITEFEPLAREAGCSLPTVRKHYPSKEALYRDCTQTFAESLAMPDLDALRDIASTERRVEESISELCRIHEAMFGYAWFGAHSRKDSPTLEAVMSAYDGLADAITKIVVREDGSRYPIVRGILDFLTYRALRLSGELAPEPARRELIATVRPLVTGDE